MEASPVNTILHEWHFDPAFCDGAGIAKALPFEGPSSFSTLVAKYAGDIPPGAIRSTLQKAGILVQDANGLISVTQPYFYPRTYDVDFVRGLAFSLGNLGSTLAFNAAIHRKSDLSNQVKGELARLERAVCSEHLTREGAARFKAWVDQAATRFLDEANHLICENELPKAQWSTATPRAIGVAVYYYEED